MNADFCFRMGATHAICQDYAVAGVRGELAYAILSDGCSGSPVPGEPGSPYTDFGARLLVRSSLPKLDYFARDDFLSTYDLTSLVFVANQMAKAVGLPQTALDATLLFAIGKREVGVNVFRCADGVVAARKRTGEVSYSVVEYGNSTPIYPSYLLDVVRRRQAIQQAKTITRKSGSIGSELLVVTEELADTIGNMTSNPFFNAQEYDLVLLFSDGVESFYEVGTGRPVPLEEVLAEVCAIKGFTGQFLARRCQRFLGAVCQERGWRHADDFSVAGIYLGEAP